MEAARAVVPRNSRLYCTVMFQMPEDSVTSPTCCALNTGSYPTGCLTLGYTGGPNAADFTEALTPPWSRGSVCQWSGVNHNGNRTSIAANEVF